MAPMEIEAQGPRGPCVCVALDTGDSGFAPERDRSRGGEGVADAEHATVYVEEIPAESDFSSRISAIARERAERLVARYSCRLIHRNRRAPGARAAVPHHHTIDGDHLPAILGIGPRVADDDVRPETIHRNRLVKASVEVIE